MASDNEASCESDPNFAVICAFMEKFGGTCGLASIDFMELQEMLENTQEVSQELIDLHIKLLRKSRKTVSTERWERAIIKICHGFCIQDAWEIERFGYKKARLSSKIRVLKELLEMQFDYNARFKAEINKMSAEELRSQPLGKDKQGHAYWFQNDSNCQIRVYKEDPDEETWTLVAKDRDGLVSLINELSNGDSKISSESAINEDDSNSLLEKPIIDTGQVDSSSSDSTKKVSSESENSNESKKEEDISTPPGETTLENEDSEEEKSLSPPHLTAESEIQGAKGPGTTDQPNEETQEMERLGTTIETNEETQGVKQSGTTDQANEETQGTQRLGMTDQAKEETQGMKGLGTTDQDKEETNIEANEETQGTKRPGTTVQADEEAKKPKLGEVGEAIEEPLMLVKGVGSGEENECVNSIVCEEISSSSVSSEIIPTLKNEDCDEEESRSPSHLNAESEIQGIKRPGTTRLGMTVVVNEETQGTQRLGTTETNEETQGMERLGLTETNEETQGMERSGTIFEAIEQPVMLVKGEGSGNDNECVNPIVGEEIEEDTVFFYGCGSGDDCQTGNEDRDAKKSDGSEDKSAETVSSDKSTNKDAGSSDSSVSISDSSKNCASEDADGSLEEVPTSPVKKPFKLGTIIDTKTDNKFFNAIRTPAKKSRWDVETIIAKETDCDEDEEKEESEATTPKKSMFFFGPSCLQFSPTVSFGEKVPQTDLEEEFEEKKKGPVIPSNTKGDIGYRIDGKGVEYEETIECVQSSEENGETTSVDRKTPIESRRLVKLEDRNAESEETKATESKLEEEIVPESEASDLTIPSEEMKKLPEVTATLVECEETGPKKEEPTPLIEEKCVKKQAYVLGEDSTKANSIGARVRKSKSMNDVKKSEEEIDSEANVSVIKKAASEENVLNLKKEEAKDNCEETKNAKEEKQANNNKRGRKNNISENQPKIFTRRSTRSSKNEEAAPKTIAEKPKLTETTAELSAVKEEESADKMKPEEAAGPPRRGRSRVIAKAGKAETVDGDGSKKMKMSSESRNKKSEENEEAEESKVVEAVTIESSNSSDLVELPDHDPLAVSSEETKKEEKPLSLSTFSLDFNESLSAPLTRSGLRKRGRESPQNAEEVEETAGKRLKKGKRNIDVKLRKSVEEQKKQELVSSDDAAEEKSPKKKAKHKKELKNEETVVVSSDAESAKEAALKKSKINKNKRLLSSLGIDPERMGLGDDSPVGVRQSRRIAQLKIKEEAERRKMEDEIAPETHRKKKKKKKSDDKNYRVEKKRWKEPEEEEGQDDDSGDSKKKKKKKKKKRRKFDEFNPWRSSSDSSSSNEEEDDEIPEESDDEVLQFVSDHEFSPESDLEGDGEALPLKRARTARKESDVEEVDDCPCQKCGKSDHPEWILLCDKCDNGWHCSCLRPPLLVIPEGDWFCPPCQHVTLLTKLQDKLKEYDKTLRKKELDDRRKQRLAYVGISLNSVLPTKDTENVKNRRRKSREKREEDNESSSEESESGSGSDSASDSDEPIYQLRQRRQAHSYRFNDYDDLINSAIQEEMEAVKGAGNLGRGKDISTIVNAEKVEETKIEGEQAEAPEPLPPVVPPDDRDKEAKPLYSDDEPVQGVRKKIIGRKKHRKLNALDVSSGDDEDSDEDFKGTSSESDDDFDDDLGSDDSDLDGGRNRRRNMDPVRRSTRARIARYDADFIDDGDSDDEDAAPSRKKKRSIWDESESEESDRSWGRRKRKPASKQKKPTASAKKKKSKKKKKDEDSDAEVYRKKKPKIKFGLDDEDDGPVRRTRGKKINYIDALGSDSDEDRVKRAPPRIESEEEYVANDEDFDEEDKASDEEDDGAAKTDSRFAQLLPEGVPALKDFEDGDDEPNPIDQINRNIEMMDENEMEKMMEEEEYANKQLQLVALQLEKEKRRKEREAKKLEGLLPPQLPPQLPPPQLPPLQEQGTPKKRGRKPKNQFQFSGPMQEPLVGNVDNLLVNSENNDELSEPPGVSLPLFAELAATGEGGDDAAKKRRTRGKKSLEEAVASLGSVRQQESAAFMALCNKGHPTDLSSQESNIEIAAPPQPFSQSQPTPSVITRMLQSKPGQAGYPIGTIRPKQFATMPERDEDGPTSHHSMAPAPAHHGQYLQGTALRPQLSSPYRQMPSNMNHYPRGAPPPPHQIRNPVPQSMPSHIYHSHRPMDPSPSGGGTISIPEHNSPGRVVSPAASSPGSNKNDTPPPPYSRPPVGGRFPPINTNAGPRHLQMVPPHLQPPRPNLSPYHPSMPPSYHYGQFGQPPMGEEAMPPTVYENSPYSDQFPEGPVNPSENSNSKSFDEESGGEFGGLVSYFSSQREDDLES